MDLIHIYIMTYWIYISDTSFRNYRLILDRILSVNENRNS